MRRTQSCFALALLLLLLLGSTRHAAAIPSDDLLNSLEPTADVNDYAGILSPEEKAALEARCRTLREKTGAQLAVVTLQSLQGGQIDDFTNKLFARWGIGQKEKKNGLLLLVAMEDRKSRIEVGYGLEPIIPDVLAGRILDHQLKPRFREKQYAAGLTAAVNALCELVERNEPADRAALAAEKSGSSSDTISAIVFIAFFVFIGAAIAGIGSVSRLLPVMAFGLLFAGFPMLVALAIAFPLAPIIHLPTSILGYLAGRYLARHGGDIGRGGGSGRRSKPSSNWGWQDFSGGSSGGWSSSSGGFSQSWGGFGGGSSGGGGASSSW